MTIKSLGRGAMQTVCVAGIVVAALYVLYRLRMPEAVVSDVSVPEKYSKVVPHDTLLHLGSLRFDERPHRFLDAPMAKPAGSIRIGCFGDSFTFGDEVDGGADYPSILSELLATHGLKNFEVLNFGNSWWGSHQAFMLWDEVGRKFALDYVLLGPTIFRPERDLTFNHARGADPAYIHSRYVLDGREGIKRVDIPGRDRAEIAAAYRSFIPPWNALRFDLVAPASILSYLPSGRFLRNPLYYSRQSVVEEALRIFRIMVARIRASGARVIVGNEQPGLVGSEGFTYKQVSTFPYLRPQGHNSAIGNRDVAWKFFQKLTGARSDVRSVRALAPMDAATTAPAPFRVLSGYERAFLAIGPEVIGELSDNSVPREADRAIFRTLGIEGLLAFTDGDDTPPLEAVWLPVKASLLQDGRPVEVIAPFAGRAMRRTLGPVRLLRPGVPIGVVETKWAHRTKTPYRRQERVAFSLPAMMHDASPVESPRESGIYIDGERVASLALNGAGRGAAEAVVPAAGPFIAMRAVGRRLTVDAWPRLAPVELVLAEEGSQVRVPVGTLEVSGADQGRDVSERGPAPAASAAALDDR